MNVQDAITAVLPFGLDLSGSVRTNDCLNEIKVREFFAAAFG